MCVPLDRPEFGCAAASCASCAFPGANAGCVGGACALGACLAGKANCDNMPSNGCEVTLATDSLHCGTCTTTCDTTLGLSCQSGTCAAASGCADGTREGFVDRVMWPTIAACQGTFSGWIDEPSAASLCATGWHVCRGNDAVVHTVSGIQATGFNGCYAFDTAQDCNQCFPTCRGSLGQCGPACCVPNDPNDPDMGGMGLACAVQALSPNTSCLATARLDATTNSGGCQWRTGLSGVVCCQN